MSHSPSHSPVGFCPITPLPGDPRWRFGRSLRFGGPEPDPRKGVAYKAWRSAVLQCCTLLAPLFGGERLLIIGNAEKPAWFGSLRTNMCGAGRRRTRDTPLVALKQRACPPRAPLKPHASWRRGAGGWTHAAREAGWRQGGGGLAGGETRDAPSEGSSPSKLRLALIKI